MSRKRLLLLKVVSAFMLTFMTITACNNQPKEIDLTYEGVEQIASAGKVKLNEARKPSLMVVSRPAEVDGLDGLITDETRTALLALDYSVYFVLAAFQGWKPCSCYSILVSRISRVGNTVNVYIQLHEPSPDEEKADIVTSPFHLIIVRKDDNWGKVILFNLIVDATIVDSVSHDIP